MHINTANKTSTTNTVKIKLPYKKGRGVLALGAEMHSAFCFAKDGIATLSEDFGNTSDSDTFHEYRNKLKVFLEQKSIKPDIVVCDMHPSYNISGYAEQLSMELGAKLVKVQHHVAHAYSVAGEKGFSDFTAIVCDGLGYGSDGNLWGGEVFRKDQRVGHLEEQHQLGGDSATTHPAKFLYSVLSRFMGEKDIDKTMSSFFSVQELDLLKRQLAQRFNCPVTTSCGRVLDSASVLLGFCRTREYEGSPAIILEKNSTEPYDLEPVIEDDVLMTTPIFKFLVENMEEEGKERARLAATVQAYLAKGLLSIAKKHGEPVVFSGGCAHNRIMSDLLVQQGVHLNENTSRGDGGISFGQAVYVLADPGHDIP